jgi:hypothetical protein
MKKKSRVLPSLLTAVILMLSVTIASPSHSLIKPVAAQATYLYTYLYDSCSTCYDLSKKIYLLEKEKQNKTEIKRNLDEIKKADDKIRSIDQEASRLWGKKAYQEQYDKTQQEKSRWLDYKWKNEKIKIWYTTSRDNLIKYYKNILEEHCKHYTLPPQRCYENIYAVVWIDPRDGAEMRVGYCEKCNDKRKEYDDFLKWTITARMWWADKLVHTEMLNKFAEKLRDEIAVKYTNDKSVSIAYISRMVLLLEERWVRPSSSELGQMYADMITFLNNLEPGSIPTDAQQLLGLSGLAKHLQNWYDYHRQQWRKILDILKQELINCYAKNCIVCGPTMTSFPDDAHKGRFTQVISNLPSNALKLIQALPPCVVPHCPEWVPLPYPPWYSCQPGGKGGRALPQFEQQQSAFNSSTTDQQGGADFAQAPTTDQQQQGGADFAQAPTTDQQQQGGADFAQAPTTDQQQSRETETQAPPEIETETQAPPEIETETQAPPEIETETQAPPETSIGQ